VITAPVGGHGENNELVEFRLPMWSGKALDPLATCQ
jgi:hypothetical protein